MASRLTRRVSSKLGRNLSRLKQKHRLQVVAVEFSCKMNKSDRVQSPSRMWSAFMLVLMAMGVSIVSLYPVVQARAQDDRLAGGSGSPQASQRLMKELKDFYKSDSYRNGVFTVELVDDDIYEWHVKIFINDPDIPLHRDLRKLKRKGGQDHILLHVKYNDNYPFKPPFVRLVYPYLNTILSHGAICMELLSTGWNKDYTIESLILQILAEKIIGARVYSSDNPKDYYTYEDAKTIFDTISDSHKQDGWWTTTTPEPQE